jgi:integrase
VAEKRIGLREVRALEPNSIVWDAVVPGFGARRQKGARVSYVLVFRTTNGRPRWHTIGRHDAPWKPDTARSEALRLLGEVVKGNDPAGEKQARRKAVTVAELCDDYWHAASTGRLLTRRGTPKASLTLESDTGRIERHIKPLIGRLPVASLKRDDVETMMHAIAAGETATKAKGKPRGLAVVKGGRGAATKSVSLLGAILSWAVQRGLRSDNPVHGTRVFAAGRRERRLSEAEYAALGAALREAEARTTAMATASVRGETNIWPAVIAAIRFAALSGWRRGEVLALRWAEIDLSRRTVRLKSTKTGASTRPLSSAAASLLQRQATVCAPGAIFVFPRIGGDAPMIGFRRQWLRIAKLGALATEVVPHVLRHSFVSVAADLGFTDSTIGALVGHTTHSTTSRYTHFSDPVLLAAADAVASRIAMLMDKAETGGVIALPARELRDEERVA